MKRYEKESLLKNFLVFFSLLEILLILLFSELYSTKKKEYKQTLFKTMQVCSYTFKCEQFVFDFSAKDKTKLQQIFEDDGFYSYFTIPKSEKFYIKISYPKESIDADLQALRHELWIIFILATLFLLGISLFFTFYSLNPIRKALQLNDEFIKDILHDFNTPITAMVLNIKMFNESRGADDNIQRVSRSIKTILHLQNNLKSFLHHSPAQNREVDIAKLAKTRFLVIQELYPKLHYHFIQDNALIKISHEDAITRILDNLLSNAAKYNQTQGEIRLTILKDILIIQDTGKGIKDTKKVMQRYYKEQTRGLGLGLHIVQKLSEELGIMIDIDSQPNKGTKVTLDFSSLKKSQS